MSLKHALLGFINYGPMTGYEIKKFFDTSVAHFWNAELSQIYPALKAMESDGLVEMKVEVQEDRPNRKEYSITEKGRRELLDWLAQPAEREQVREPILIKVFFGAALRKDELLEVLRTEAEAKRQYLYYLEQGCSMIGKFAEAIGLNRDAVFWRLTVDAGQRHCRAELEWLEAAVSTIEALDHAVFANGSHDWAAMDVHSASEILERLKTAMPEAFAHHTGRHEAMKAAVD